jgi:hypothetical protein
MSWLESIMGPFGVGTSHGHSDSLGHTTPRAREYATTILPIVYSATLRRTHIQMAQIPGTPKLESRNPPKCPGSGLSGLWEGITPRPTSDRDEVWTEVVALVEIFPTAYRTPESDIGSGSIPDF